ncbi:FCD domain-containing protein [Nocardioides sp. TF02-7]|uniref:FadR/GntR family transcriptional regulator n=1 Tax=Nocardioides sp. TF02-7 TaxID=2917724 RepID=UPI001F05FF38|nr:FCD domain-containing protein [Nocardioides sp. TF02-7]UMG91263.1 FCD domain-containing protein [Nocardioides sp. TF02-7]
MSSADGPVRTARRDKLANTIAQSMLRDIRRRGLSTGDQLPKEAEMLTEYGVGRGTLREALRVLETCGLIVVKPGPRGGPVVQDVHPDDFGRVASLFFQFAGVTYRELIGARLILEPTAARQAAQQQKGSDAARELVRLAEHGPATGDDEEYLHVTADFHASLTALGGNSLVTLMCHSLAEIYHDRVRGVLFPKSRQGEVHEVHAAIARAVLDGDAAEAESLMAQHMEQYRRYVVKKHPALLDEIVIWQNRY